MSWQDWWVWAAGALILGILEILIPSWIFLGFAMGAGVIAILLAIGVPFATSLPAVLVVFAIVSLISWIALRRVLGVQKNQVKTFDHDVND